MIEKIITINNELCKQDGLCAQICPMKIFIQETKKTPHIEKTNHCVLCGQCLAVCPASAIHHSRLRKEDLVQIVEPHPVNEKAMMTLIRQRRSVRVYKNKEIPADVLEEIADSCGYCPTGAHGQQGWVRNITIVSGQENMKRILDLTVEYMRMLKSKLEGFVVNYLSRWIPEIQGGLATLPDISLRLAQYEKGRDVILYNAPAAIFVHAPRNTSTPQIDCDAALYSMMLLAHTKGLGTCWMGWVQNAAAGFQVKSFTALRDFLKIPTDHRVYGALIIGYPKIQLHSIPPRETRINWIN
ncbi:nitroreductase family protein [candidate division CSSED10-310 bacterium]|uniref:Nitroreductase family protein n=1 Tax=candidate division CSSED10-310 bacterium TaxID=2855610 RepID=A0ABV6Z3H7_UNCC1